MKRQDFYNLVRDPNRIRKADLRVLNQMTAAYPYFQSGHILCAKGHVLHAVPGAKKKVSMAAMYVANRKQLKHLLTQFPEKRAAVAPASPHSTKKRASVLPVIEPKSSFDYHAGLLSETERDHLIQEVYQRLDELKVARRLYHEQSQKLEDQFGIDKETSASDTEEAPHQEDRASYGNEVDDEDEDEEASPSGDHADDETPPDVRAQRYESTATTQSPQKPNNSETNQQDGVDPLEMSGADATSTTMGFHIPAPSTTEETKGEDDTEQANTKQSSEHFDINTLPVKANRKPPSKKAQDQQALLDTFIRNLPRLDQVKPPEDVPMIDDEDDVNAQIQVHLYTEAIAAACEKQKKYRKAMEIYNALKVKYPEKTTYFEQKIKTLRDQIT